MADAEIEKIQQFVNLLSLELDSMPTSAEKSERMTQRLASINAILPVV